MPDVRRPFRILAAFAATAVTLAVLAALAGGAVAAPRIDPPHPGRSLSGATSTNWAGYSATSAGGFTSVTATWTQPAVRRSPIGTYAAFWVGLDGDGSHTVEQIGSMGYTSGGRAYYVAWYELYPAAMQAIDPAKLTVRPGDVLTATVRWTGATTFRLSLTDKTTGRTFSSRRSQQSPQFTAPPVSAEVIAERPSSTTGVLPLARFGIVGFSGCSINGGTLAAAGASSIDMVDPGATIASTSALGSDDASFTVSDDFTGPKVTATGLQRSATAGWRDKAVTVKLKGSDGSGGSGVAAVYYTLDGGPTQTYTRSFSVSGAGSHKVEYWAVDVAGNTGSTKTGYVNLDLSAPSSAPEALSVTGASAVRGSVLKVAVAVTDPLPTCGTANVLARITTASGMTVARGTRIGMTVNGTTTVRVTLPATLTRGVYSLRTRATDTAGNVQVGAGRAQLTVE
jgi:hypothetical protein